MRTWRICTAFTVTRALFAAHDSCTARRASGAEVTRSPATASVGGAAAAAGAAGAGAIGVAIGAGGAAWHCTIWSARAGDDSSRVSPVAVPAGPHHELAWTRGVPYSVSGTGRWPPVPPPSWRTKVPWTAVVESTTIR